MTLKDGSLSWYDPDKFNGYGLSPHSADTTARERFRQVDGRQVPGMASHQCLVGVIRVD
jgi:hypothetical protein